MPHPEEILRVRLVREGAALPQRATAGSAGLDLSACLPEPLVVPAGGRAMIPTGVAIALPDPSFVALLFARSSLGMRRGLLLTNGVGVIDSDYRGEILVGVYNFTNEPCIVENGERIAQLLVSRVSALPVLECAELYLSWLGMAADFGLAPTTVDLAILKLTFGLQINLNVAQAILLLAAILIYSRIHIHD